MARGLFLCSNGIKPSTLFSSSVSRVSFSFSPKTLFASYPLKSRHLNFSRLFCKLAFVPETVDETRYKELFNRRMDMAGLKPHHRIALGVSGGPDSMALCVLTAKWKSQGLNNLNKTDGFIDGLVAIVVDHGLRLESKDEAEVVCRRVSEMGIRCEIARCDWVNGRPKQGHLQEEAREMRYQMLSNVCFRQEIEVLLIAHHADDQAELFILRLSRGSGVLGLAGTAFASEFFSRDLELDAKHMKNRSILLVRPLLDLWKEDMYKICQWGRQEWVEDPTNRSQLFVRNRIRTSIGNLQSGTFKSELQAVISECRRTRSFVDKVCTDLIKQTVTVTDKGYAVLDLERLNPTEVKDICLSKYLAAVLQFISQRQRPIRGNTSKLLLKYLRALPCKTSLTAAGCYLSPAPGSKGTKIIVSCFVDCSLASKTELLNICFKEAQRKSTSDDLRRITSDAKSFSDHAASRRLLDVASEYVLSKAREINLLSDSTCTTVELLQRDETNRFINKTEDKSVDEKEHGSTIASSSDKVHLWPGQNLYFTNRFLIRWNLSDHQCDEAGCGNCPVRTATSLEVRHMVESDWLYLAELSRCSNTNHSTSSSQQALRSLKFIPAAARRSLPVLINHSGLLLSVPAIGFNYCPCLEVSAVFLPRVPLGGGLCSFL